MTPTPAFIPCNMEMLQKTAAFQRKDLTHTQYYKIRSFILSYVFLLFPLRLAFILLTLFLYWAYLRVVDLGYFLGLYGPEMREEAAREVAIPGARFLMFNCGVHTITRYHVTEDELYEHRKKYIKEQEEGANDEIPRKDTRPSYMVVSNHHAFWDPAVIVSEFGECSFVVKADLATAPILGKLLHQLKTLFAGKGGVIDEINKRVKKYYETKEKSRFLIFPEGTTTNGHYMLHFHDGAFIPGCGVQPVVTRYKYNAFCPGWIGSDLEYFKNLFSSFNNDLYIVHFPPYVPTETEKKNPKLFALNVRRAMALLSNKYVEKEVGPLLLSDAKFVRTHKPETVLVTSDLHLK